VPEELHGQVSVKVMIDAGPFPVESLAKAARVGQVKNSVEK